MALPKTPLRGSDILNLCIWVPTTRFPSHPLWVGRHLVVRVLPIGTTRGWCVKPPGPDLYRGASAPTCSYEEVHLLMLALIRLRWPRFHSDPNSAPWCPVSNFSQLGNTGTMLTRKVPDQFSPSGLSKHPRTGSVRTPHTFLTTGRIRGLHEPSAKSKIVYMKLTFRLSFQLNRSIRGYTIGTTARFWVTTTEALAPWPHLWILRRYP
jgi:hypothetical protein